MGFLAWIFGRKKAEAPDEPEPGASGTAMVPACSELVQRFPFDFPEIWNRRWNDTRASHVRLTSDCVCPASALHHVCRSCVRQLEAVAAVGTWEPAQFWQGQVAIFDALAFLT